MNLFSIHISSKMEIAIIWCIGSETDTHFSSLSTLNIWTHLFSKSFILSIDYQYPIQYALFNPVAATQCVRHCRLFIPGEITATSQLYAIYIYIPNEWPWEYSRTNWSKFPTHIKLANNSNIKYFPIPDNIPILRNKIIRGRVLITW